MKRLLVSLSGICLLVLLMETGLYAWGFGAYLGGAAGEDSWWYNVSGDARESIDRLLTSESASTIGGGLVFDTNVTSEDMINYRLSLFYERHSTMHCLPNTTASYHIVLNQGRMQVGMNRFGLYNAVGFNLLKTEMLRLWLGPQLGLYYAFGDGSGVVTSYVDSTALGISSRLLLYRYRYDYSSFGFSMGPVLGVNVNFGSHYTVFAECAVRFTFTHSKVSRSISESNYEYPLGHVINSYGYEGYIALGVLYRLDDDER
ncbi:MAG: hypothetical protein JXA20_18080 [Spirochaetes bacterium]|nr:hypothetical protein [Spirochaetota bacterium]